MFYNYTKNRYAKNFENPVSYQLISFGVHAAAYLLIAMVEFGHRRSGGLEGG